MSRSPTNIQDISREDDAATAAAIALQHWQDMETLIHPEDMAIIEDDEYYTTGDNEQSSEQQENGEQEVAVDTSDPSDLFRSDNRCKVCLHRDGSHGTSECITEGCTNQLFLCNVCEYYCRTCNDNTHYQPSNVQCGCHSHEHT